jgi:hypothetical protein
MALEQVSDSDSSSLADTARDTLGSCWHGIDAWH